MEIYVKRVLTVLRPGLVHAQVVLRRVYFVLQMMIVLPQSTQQQKVFLRQDLYVIRQVCLYPIIFD